jgi:RNA polymerase sigma-70 factor (ECF subfamily)
MDSREADLIQRWQQGEVAAFEEIVRRWQQPISRFLFRLTGNTETASDLLQEVFLRVYQAAARYRENGAFERWLYRVALNVARDAARRRRPVPLPLANREISTRAGAADVICQQKELKHIVAQAMADLPEPLRLVLVLRHYEQLNFEEMARLLGTPPSTLKSRFAAALERLRHRLQELGWGPEEMKT